MTKNKFKVGDTIIFSGFHDGVCFKDAVGIIVTVGALFYGIDFEYSIRKNIGKISDVSCLHDLCKDIKNDTGFYIDRDKFEKTTKLMNKTIKYMGEEYV